MHAVLVLRINWPIDRSVIVNVHFGMSMRVYTSVFIHIAKWGFRVMAVVYYTTIHSESYEVSQLLCDCN